MVPVFLKILGMGLTASYCIIFICAARLFLRKFPKVFSYMLWGIAAIRLVCPVGFESRLSLVGEPVIMLSELLSGGLSESGRTSDAMALSDTKASSDTMAPSDTMASSEATADSFDAYRYGSPDDYYSEGYNGNYDNGSRYDVGYDNQNYYVKDNSNENYNAGNQLTGMYSSAVMASKRSLLLKKLLIHVAAYVWFAVALGLTSYYIISYWHLKRKLGKNAVCSGEYKRIPVRTVKGIDTPFVLGVWKAAIYLPDSLAGEERSQCLAHEYTHVCRRDYLIKQFAFLLVCVYWFNPLVWLAFHLMTKDMEMSCDEMTLKGAKLQERKAYSGVLLQLSSERQPFAGYPLAFSRNNVSSRIKNVLNYKNRSLWATLLCIILVTACAAGLLTDPVNKSDEPVLTDTDTAPAGIVSADTDSPDNIFSTASMTEGTEMEESESSINKRFMEEGAVIEKNGGISGYKNLYAKAVVPGQDGRDEIITGEMEKGADEKECEAKNTEAKEIKTNGIEANGIETNGIETNGIEANGIEANGIETMEKEINGIKIKEIPDDRSDAVIGTLNPGDMVQVLSIGCSVKTDGIRYGDFGEIKNPADDYTFSYAMILFQDTEGRLKRGYVKTDSLSLDVPENTIDTYIYWTSKVWCDYFCTKNYTSMSQLAAVDEEQFNSDLFNSLVWNNSNSMVFPWTGYYLSIPANPDYAEGADASIYYFEESTWPSMTVWRQDLTIQREKLENISRIEDLLYGDFHCGGGSVCYSEARRCDSIADYDEFLEVYLTGDFNLCFASFDYEGSPFFKPLASLHSCNVFIKPEFALRHYLHLEDAIETEEVAKARVHEGDCGYTDVKCTFPNGAALTIPMYQKDGLWFIDREKLQQYFEERRLAFGD